MSLTDAIKNKSSVISENHQFQNCYHHCICCNYEMFIFECSSTFDLQEEFKNTNGIAYTRTVQELSAPFNDSNSEVSKAGMKLLSIKTHHVPCVFQTKWVTDSKMGMCL